MDNFYELKKLRDKVVEDSKNKYLEQSKKQLEVSIEKKIRTAFIGAISEFEQTFGFLWGFDKVELSDDQIAIINILEESGFDLEYFRQIWEEARTEILNKGNNQIRANKDDLRQYTISWDRYKTELPVRPIKEVKNEE